MKFLEKYPNTCDIALEEENNTKSTIGAEFSSIITYKDETKTEKIRLDLWDTAGQERYRFIIPLYFKNADIFLLVFDINERKDFESLSGWVKIIEENKNENRGYPPIILVANKTDKKGVQISDEEIDSFVADNPIIAMWMKTNRFKGEKITDLKMGAVKLALSRDLTHNENILPLHNQGLNLWDTHKPSFLGKNC
jgi:small GTP-binding protein